jgi:hypothetical protein
MEDQRTCGKGLAEHSALPAKLGELTAAMAENLEIHMRSFSPCSRRAWNRTGSCSARWAVDDLRHLRAQAVLLLP